MSEQITTAETIEAVAAELGLSMTAEFVPWSLSRNAGEKQPSLNWKVTIHRQDAQADRGQRVNVFRTDYGAGSGHCPGYKHKSSGVRDQLCRWECEHGRPGFWSDGLGIVMGKSATPILPKFADVLHSLCSDADAIDYGGFEEWAENYGEDTDSRKAEVTYRACLGIALKLRNALGEAGFAKLREACQGY